MSYFKAPADLFENENCNAQVLPNFMIFWNWTPKNTPDRQLRYWLRGFEIHEKVLQYITPFYSTTVYHSILVWRGGGRGGRGQCSVFQLNNNKGWMHNRIDFLFLFNFYSNCSSAARQC